MNGLTLMAVHAHPDDETIGTGGVLLKAAAAGVRTVVVCATGGEEGEIHRPDLDQERDRTRLGEIREQELRESCRLLNVSAVHLLGYRDSGMANTPANEGADTFHRAELEEVVGRLVRVIRQERPDVVITYDARGGYGHPDHIATHRATVAAFHAAGDPARFDNQELPPWRPRKLYYTAFPREDLIRFQEMLRENGVETPFSDDEGDLDAFTVSAADITTRVDVEEFVPTKMAALRVHETQVRADDFWFSLPPDMQKLAFGTETFVRAFSAVAVPEREVELFEGLLTVSNLH